MTYFQCLIIVVILILIWLNYEHSKTVCVLSTVDNRAYPIVETFSSENNQECADMMANINKFIVQFIDYMQHKYLIEGKKDGRYNGAEVAKTLAENYDPNTLKENFPTDLKYTSYVMDKGSEVAFCLHPQGQPRVLHDFDLLKFVILHELAHIASPHVGHPVEFWRVFKLLMEEAVEAGLYVPIDYKNNPVKYCGIQITYSPYYDQSL